MTVSPIAQTKRALTIREFCAAYSISRSTTYKLIASGKLRTFTIGRRRLVAVEEAEKLIKLAAA